MIKFEKFFKMQKVIIHQFGPLKDIELEVNNFMVLIGPQASGKSTISKTIYFFKSLRDDLIKYLFECVEKNTFDKHLGNFSKIIRNKFLQFWGPSYHLNDIHLRYFYSSDINITLKMKGKYIDPIFSDEFERKFLTFADEVKIFSKKLSKRNPAFMSSSEYLAVDAEKKSFYKRIELVISELFSDNKDQLFIPAGRSLLTTLSDQLQVIHPHKLDFLMRAFIDRINNSKPFFNKSLSELVQDRKMLTYEKVDTENVNLAKAIIEKILKGKYRYDSEGEKLFYENNKYVKINFASSGQQESIWILLLIFLQVLDRTNSFIVFEEPEAHLYPEAQKQIIDLIALLINTSNNQVIITTHSPYILSSINNLLYASKLGKVNKKRVMEIVSEKMWLDPKGIQAFFIDKGMMKPIIDSETELIETDAIDSASKIINDIYYKLFEIDE